ncbi:molybdopterin molybdotransferase MoeA [Pedobacter cryophilus]|uniref:Molybdopterin molybdenumtransferase n=1 Tax=Pedobacter cryophilus TaxID=2571271 RepID=A0A4U1C337_9SPHI|nr:molybdopterin molybdotransferase MoeA [Pedobacter cryophilus]TKB97604.1 molybdopterin molybdotransferase MoeA [Pedobacter cryophilus]
MISFQEAQSIILSKAKSFGVELVILDDALNRVLAEDIFAQRDYPPFNRSAMDGIAVRFDDLQNGINQFKFIEIIFAGQANINPLKTGECYKIMTGAAVPKDANVVIKREDISEENGSFILNSESYKEYQNIALQGQDLKKGDIAVLNGTLINIPTIGLLASLGKSQISVQKLPKVNIITTGNEVVDLNHSTSSFQIHNSNLYVLKALLTQNQIKNQNCSHVNDDVNELEIAISANLDADILILTGGVSAGDADYVPEILAKIGIEKLFHKVAIKPGKPVWCGKLSNQLMVFALPGNPFSCMVTFKLFVELYIKASTRYKKEEMLQLPIDFLRSKNSNLDEFFPVEASSTLKAISINGSGDIRLGNLANALAMQSAAQKKLEKGTMVSYFPL